MSLPPDLFRGSIPCGFHRLNARRMDARNKSGQGGKKGIFSADQPLKRTTIGSVFAVKSGFSPYFAVFR
jgi:hypothetical protein